MLLQKRHRGDRSPGQCEGSQCRRVLGVHEVEECATALRTVSDEILEHTLNILEEYQIVGMAHCSGVCVMSILTQRGRTLPGL